jgi:DMSO reductase anchor subunit
MHPAPSIIAFTTTSGLGYGLLFLLALGGGFGLIPTNRWLGGLGLALALALISAGLLASLLHLGRPARAVLALSQWRTSWLSREGVAALLTFAPALILLLAWAVEGRRDGVMLLPALLAAAGSAATVWCTGMIYGSLKPVAAWHQPLTAPLYLAFALMSGALAVHLLLCLFGFERTLAGVLALLTPAAAFGVKIAWWRTADRPAAASMASATGLGRYGKVRPLDPPHTETNYLLDEMGYRLGRRHAARLRRLSLVFGLGGATLFTLPAVLTDAWPAIPLAALALASGLLGIVLERWLFFAEATHTAMLYYGRTGAEGEHGTGTPAVR